MNYEFDKGLHAKLFNIFDAVAKKGTYSAGDVIDIINSHNDMHFGTKDLSRELVEIIFYALHKDNENVAKYLVKEYHGEYDSSVLVYKSLMAEIDPILVDEYFDMWELKPTDRHKAIAIVLQILRRTNSDYFEILLGNEKVITSLTSQNVSTMFHTFTKKFMLSDKVVPRWKELLSKFKHLDNIMIEVSSDDEELLNKFYPNAVDIFLF